MNAPFCPVSRSQPLPLSARGTVPVKLPVIPKATDLPSLIRAINVIRDILRSVTTSLTVNNVDLGKPPLPTTIYIASANPQWYRSSVDTKTGFVFHKDKDKYGDTLKDEDQRAYVQRINQIEYANTNRTSDKDFTWKYIIALDSEYGDSKGVKPFEEDFFERIVNVQWDIGLAVEFGDKDEDAPKP